MATVTRTFELSAEAAAELDRRAELERRAPSDVVNELLLNDSGISEGDFTPAEWAHIQKGLEDERFGRFVPHEQVQVTLNKYRGSH